LESYYEKRYKNVLKVINSIYEHRGDLVDQTTQFIDIDFIFTGDYYFAEGNSK